MSTESEVLAPESKLGKRLAALAAMKEQANVLEAQILKDQAELVILLEKAGHDRFSIDTSYSVVKGVVVRAERVIYDAEGLRDDLTDDQWDKCTKTVLDTSLLEACVAAKVIPIETVAAHSEVKPNKAYIKLGIKKKNLVKKPSAVKRNIRATVI